jgi:hypothetical protein
MTSHLLLRDVYTHGFAVFLDVSDLAPAIILVYC